MTKMMLEYPNLPLLSLERAFKVFKLANLGPSFIAEKTGLSRVAVSRLMNGHSPRPNKATQEVVSTLAYKALRALKHKHYPRTKAVAKSSDDYLSDTFYGTSLSLTAPEELLPKSWLDTNDSPKVEDATP